MAEILSFPFRLDPQGRVVTVTQGSDQANAEQIAVLLSTIQGERHMAPGFGIPDPAFAGLPAGVVTGQVALYGPRVDITAITTQPAAGNEIDVTVGFR
jgi:phage baseplate assembly protein W